MKDRLARALKAAAAEQHVLAVVWIIAVVGFERGLELLKELLSIG